MHEKKSNPENNRAPMIRYLNPGQIPLAEFDRLDEHHLWVKHGQCIPWYRPTDVYRQDFFEREPELEEPRSHQGKLIIDTTVVPQTIRYPTDLSLLNYVSAVLSYRLRTAEQDVQVSELFFE
jgi:hypothetical protein